MSKAFASQADLDVKQVSFTKLSDNAYAYTAEGDPNTGIIIGDDAVLVLDTPRSGMDLSIVSGNSGSGVFLLIIL